jgi:hypothetical protein
MRIGSAGNVGLGTISIAGHSNHTNLFLGGTGAIHVEKAATADAALHISQNAHVDTDGSWEYRVTDEATNYYQYAGTHVWRYAASGTAGNDISWSEAMRIDSSGNVGIGTSSPSSYYANHLVVDTGSSVQSGITIVSDTGNQGMFAFADGTSGDQRYRGAIDYNHSNDSMAFLAAGSERMRILSNGVVMLALTSQMNGGDQGIELDGPNGTIITGKSSTQARTHISFVNPNGAVGTITTNSASTAYNTSSDHRLKENVVYDWDATTRLKQLKPARFNFIADAETTVDGFIAHEAQTVVPEAVVGTHNEVDADGNAVMQGIDQAKLVPLLVKTIQELEARITALESA